MGNHKMSIRTNLEKPLDARSISQTPNFKLQTSNFKTKSQFSNSNPKSQISHLNLQTSNHKPQILNLKPQTSKSQFSNLRLTYSKISNFTSQIFNPEPNNHLIFLEHASHLWKSLNIIDNEYGGVAYKFKFPIHKKGLQI